MTKQSPTSGSEGRDNRGRFAKGNSGGPGAPHGRRTAEFRRLMLDAVTDDDLRAVVSRLVELAKAGELPAIREFLDRVLGKSISSVEILEPEFEELRVAGKTPDEVKQDIVNRLSKLIPSKA